MLTEEEAKTKWCPQSGPHEGGHHPKQSCIGSACMAWRNETTEQINPDQPPHEWVPVPTGRGYCGLAGRPE